MIYIASVSWGKDSTAMLLLILEKGLPLDEVVFFDTGKEFDGIYHTRDKFLPSLADRGIKYTELKPKYSFDYLCFDKAVKSRDGSTHFGYGWCGGPCRWFTTIKVVTCRSYYKSLKDSIVEYIGIAFDEPARFARLSSNQFAPLYTYRYTELDSLNLCYSNGFDFDGLYVYLQRVSCWCCRNKNLWELNNIRIYNPSIFQKLIAMEKRIGVPMKGDRFLTERSWQDYFLDIMPDKRCLR